MIGGGFYNRHSAPQANALEYVLPWLIEAAAAMDLSPVPEAVTLADFGCSEGQNSIKVMHAVLPVLRSRTSRPLVTIHSDLPTNDFSEALLALRPQGQSVFGENTYSAILGGSMFDRLLPPRSLHVAMTFNAVGFLSRRPLDRLPGYILPNGPSALRNVGAVTETERSAFAEQAGADLESFLRARAVELVPGGKLLVQVFGMGEEYRRCPERCGFGGGYLRSDRSGDVRRLLPARLFPHAQRAAHALRGRHGRVHRLVQHRPGRVL
jgi:hypothetical protein